MTQQTDREGRVFPLADTHQRYNTYDAWLKSIFGGKCAKIPLDAGFSCPNLDGRCGVGGCIYCSGRGSGDFAESSIVPLREQYDRQRELLAKKWPTERCIPYFQARTNTYAPVAVLRPLFEEALTWPGVVGMNIATRADCLPPDTMSLLAELSEKTVLTVELGLQTTHDATAAAIIDGTAAGDADFDTEFLDYILAIKIVDSVEDAIAHISMHSTQHSEAIVTENVDVAEKFLQRILKISK